MSFNRNSSWVSVFGLVAIVCVGLLTVTGCGGLSQDDAVGQQNDTNIKRLSNLYYRFQSAHSWNGPESEEEFREYVKNDVPEFIKERIGFTTVDELFVSQRDGEPFKIRLEVAGSARGCNEPAIFEAVGVGGKRNVGFLNMLQREVDEQEYNNLWEGNFDPADLVPTG